MDKKRIQRAVSLLLIGSMSIGTIPLNSLADDLNTPQYYSVTDGLLYEVDVQLSPLWTNHSNMEITITNNGCDTIHNWFFTFETPYSIIDSWGGTIVDYDNNNTYTVGNNVYNQDILPNSSVTIGFTVYSDVEEILINKPNWYLLNTVEKCVSEDEYNLSYVENSSWEGGFTGYIILHPTVNLSDWGMDFSSNRVITSVSEAIIMDNNSNRYTIRNDGNNQNISAGVTYNIGVQGINSTDAFCMEGVEITETVLAYRLSDDLNNNQIPDYVEFIDGDNDVEDAPTVTPTESVTVTPTNEVLPTITPSLSVNPDTDSDEDGLPDYIESQLETNINNTDSDSDGLSDFEEVILGYNPHNNDTNSDGIMDIDEDYDGDGLSNSQEKTIGTDITSCDTDNDGLSDAEEISYYYTNPLDYDTDSDGVSDGEEVLIGKNPNDAIDGDLAILQTTTTLINNSDDLVITSVDITMYAKGYLDYKVNVEDLYNVDYYSRDVYGRVGCPLGLNSDEEFETATVTIHYDDAILGETNEEDLGVLWYDEDTGFYITQEQAIVNTEENTVAIDLSHFSTYVLVDLNKWDNPIIPDYSQYMFVTTHSTESIEWEGTQRTAEAMENGEFGWWKLSNRWQFEKLYTISATCTNTTPGKALSYYLYEYEWLVVDKTDSDEDGVYDFMEQAGVLASNRHVYYSSIDTDDSDGDGIIDSEEFGTYYTIIKSNDGQKYCVLKDGVVVYSTNNGEISLDSKNNFIEKSARQLSNGGSINYSVIHSNPELSDSDFDLIDDYFDGNRMYRNPDIVYIFYSEQDDDYLEIEAKDRADDYPCKVIICPVSTKDEFVNKWNAMGEDGNGKAVYYLKEVIMIFHGATDFIAIRNGYENLSYNEIVSNSSSEVLLEHKNIGTLKLSACNCGNIEYPDNVARAFMSWDTIGEVYAWDGEATYSFSTGSVIKQYPVTYNGKSMYIYINLQLSVEYSTDTIRSSMSLLYFLMISHRFQIDQFFDDSLGLVRYYKDSEGNIVYENISDARIYIDYYLCV